MFFAALFIGLGIAILLDALGIINSTFWGIFWGIFFVLVGLRMLIKGKDCPMCNWGLLRGKKNGKMDRDCCGHNREE